MCPEMKYIGYFFSLCLCVFVAFEKICHGDSENSEIEFKELVFDAYQVGLCASGLSG
jgi:hypothetical protein